MIIRPCVTVMIIQYIVLAKRTYEVRVRSQDSGPGILGIIQSDTTAVLVTQSC